MNIVWTPDRKTAARSMAREWRGTPHRHRIAVKGRGIDCVRFVIELLAQAGVIEPFQVPSYPLRWGLYSPRNIMTDLFLRHLHADEVEGAAEFGDLVVFRSGTQTNHCGIVLDADEVWHVGHQHRLGPSRLDMLRPDLQSLIRVRQTGFRESPEEIDLTRNK